MNKEEALKGCTVEGIVVKLPEAQLDRKVYEDVKKALGLIGGTWKGGKVAGFVFKEDPTELLIQLQDGNQRNLKKEFQFFGTPKYTARDLVTMANLENGMNVLEPSAGQGAIIEEIFFLFPHLLGPDLDVTVDYYELMALNQSIL